MVQEKIRGIRIEGSVGVGCARARWGRRTRRASCRLFAMEARSASASYALLDVATFQLPRISCNCSQNNLSAFRILRTVFAFADAHASSRCCRSGLFNEGSLSTAEFGGMGGKRREQPSGNAHGQQPAPKRQTRANAAEADGCADKEPRSSLAPVTISFSMRCATRAISADQGGLEAALRRVVAEFGGQDFSMGRTRVGPTDDTLQRLLPFVVEHGGPGVVLRLFQTCRPWRQELEARGFCRQTFQLCTSLAAIRPAPEDDGDGEPIGEAEGSPDPEMDRLFERLSIALQRLSSGSDQAGHAFFLDANAFLQRWWGWSGSLHQWLQAASQEPDASFLRRAASTAQILGLPLVQWVGKREGRYPGVCTLTGHTACVFAVAFSPDSKLIVSGSGDHLVKIWNAATGKEVVTAVEGALCKAGNWFGVSEGTTEVWDVDALCTWGGSAGEHALRARSQGDLSRVLCLWEPHRLRVC